MGATATRACGRAGAGFAARLWPRDWRSHCWAPVARRATGASGAWTGSARRSGAIRSSPPRCAPAASTVASVSAPVAPLAEVAPAALAPAVPAASASVGTAPVSSPAPDAPREGFAALDSQRRLMARLLALWGVHGCLVGQGRAAVASERRRQPRHRRRRRALPACRHLLAGDDAVRSPRHRPSRPGRGGRCSRGAAAPAALDRVRYRDARLSFRRGGPLRAQYARPRVGPGGVDRVAERGSAPGRSAAGHDTGGALDDRPPAPEARLPERADCRRPTTAGSSRRFAASSGRSGDCTRTASWGPEP